MRRLIRTPVGRFWFEALAAFGTILLLGMLVILLQENYG